MTSFPVYFAWNLRQAGLIARNEHPLQKVVTRQIVLCASSTLLRLIQNHYTGYRGRNGTAVVKERLDKLLMDRGLCESRSQAQALIMDGKVQVRGQAVNKPGTLIPLDEPDIRLTGLQKFVSRGGLKLEKALQVFAVDVKDRICIDVGASTGGFTDCLLQHGAAHVVAVDVGYGQLDWKLRQDDRVTVLEKTNIRTLTAKQLQQQPSLGVVDTSFISLKKVLPPLSALLAAGDGCTTEIIALLKPQFEYKDYVKDPGFKGVVRGQEHHHAIIAGVLSDLHALLPGWSLVGLDFSPITGPKGNIEFLLHWVQGETSRPALQGEALSSRIGAVIEESHQSQPEAGAEEKQG
jgi:23S rRNA (cytidine1920-2'-O)/16S rRNA (cytidine1409-2'-O)-methyltransferase